MANNEKYNANNCTMKLDNIDAMFNHEVDCLEEEKALLLHIIEKKVDQKEYDAIGNMMITVNLINAKIRQTQKLQNQIY